MKEYFFGIVEIDKKEYPYVLDNFVLTIDCDNSFRVVVGKKVWDSLLGEITGEPYCVFFSLGTVLGTTNESNGYSSFCIRISVSYYMVLEDEFSGETMLKFKNKEFAKWLGLFPVHKPEITDERFEDSIVLKRDNKEQSVQIEFEKKRYVLLPTVDLSYSFFSFNYLPSLTVKCRDVMEYNDLYRISLVVIKIMRFCFYRKYIDAGEIDICCKKDDNSEIGYKKIGSLMVNYPRQPIEPIELNSLIDFGFIPWKYIHSHIPSLVSCFERKDMFLNHLPDRKSDRFLVSFVSIPSDAAAFEYEFGRRFHDYETEKKGDPKYLEVRRKLNDLKLSEEEKCIMDDIVQYYFDSPSLKERAEFAIENYKDVIEPLLKKYSLSTADSKQIAMSFKKGRNKADHGSNTLEISYPIAKSYIVIRAIIACMQLERIGMKRDEIKVVFSFLYDKYANVV